MDTRRIAYNRASIDEVLVYEGGLYIFDYCNGNQYRPFNQVWDELRNKWNKLRPAQQKRIENILRNGYFTQTPEYWEYKKHKVRVGRNTIPPIQNDEDQAEC